MADQDSLREYSLYQLGGMETGRRRQLTSTHCIDIQEAEREGCSYTPRLPVLCSLGTQPMECIQDGPSHLS